jgi:hypothetical protein
MLSAYGCFVLYCTPNEGNFTPVIWHNSNQYYFIGGIESLSKTLKFIRYAKKAFEK